MAMREHATAKMDQEAAIGRTEDFGPRRRVSGRRTEYLGYAYACHDMALSAQDAQDRRTLHAMAILWQALAQRAVGQQS